VEEFLVYQKAEGKAGIKLPNLASGYFVVK